ncbi:type IX secretion/gliding motility protein PorT/SprT [Aureivirga marina]|uniref:type IX secretion/gliding motility protein PorT/SprT n=1 Tax=Aureivirga marina TaxID=1182451 RepID=UPI0018C98E79|nr:porin family protein [Aureivirga marina]
MKKLKNICLCISLLLCANAFAQREVVEYKTRFFKRKFHFGYYLGLNQKSFKINYQKPNAFVKVDGKVGFNVGIIGGMRINDHFSIRLEPGLSSNTKTLTFTHIEGSERDRVRQVGGTYLHVPLLIKYNALRLGNMRPYLIGGVSIDHNFSSNQDNPEDNSAGEFRMKKNNFMYEFGVGVDLYMPYFIFSPSIRGVFAINNELVRDQDPNSPWTGPIDYFGTRGIFINFAFH